MADQQAAPLLRDVGGISAGNGKQVRPGRVFRISGQIVTPEQLDALEDAGVQVVTDLRAVEEDRSRVRDWAERVGIEYRHEPIPAARSVDLASVIRGEEPLDAADAAMRTAYRWIVDNHGEEIVATLEIIAEGRVTGFGCAAGRDRTGIVTAMLHSLLGVSQPDLVAAYTDAAPDADLLRPQIRDHLGLGPDDPLPRGAEVVLNVSDGWILTALEHIAEQHGGVLEYLTANGMDPDTPARLREHLLVGM